MAAREQRRNERAADVTGRSGHEYVVTLHRCDYASRYVSAPGTEFFSRLLPHF
jgi:hypothetical protein